ncbi:AraC family transcriptional regulator [Bradyrhizobium sp. B097]|uniref:AraC family transcriptional regulator n=1 Tax=Bradyrhizobium sp. B097 TaxID=3140244 RepID=UPI0031846405
MSEQQAPTTFRFSTADWPARDRLAIWRESIGRTVIQLDTEPLSDGAFHAEATVLALPGLWLGSWALANLRAAVTRELLDGSDDLVLGIALSGAPIITHRRREATGDTGDAILMSTAEPRVSVYPSLVRFLSLRLPRKALTPFVPNPEDALMRPVPRDIEALRLLTFYADELNRMDRMATGELQHVVVTHLYDLAALVIGATRDGAAVAESRGLRTARRAAVKADINSHLGDPALTLTAVAARQHLSPRSLQRLFAEQDTSFSEYVLGARLTHAYRLLTDPRRHDRNISSIAFEAGFGDLSYFNRAIRRRYGATPSEIRATPRR